MNNHSYSLVYANMAVNSFPWLNKQECYMAFKKFLDEVDDAEIRLKLFKTVGKINGSCDNLIFVEEIREYGVKAALLSLTHPKEHTNRDTLVIMFYRVVRPFNSHKRSLHFSITLVDEIIEKCRAYCGDSNKNHMATWRSKKFREMVSCECAEVKSLIDVNSIVRKYYTPKPLMDITHLSDDYIEHAKKIVYSTNRERCTESYQAETDKYHLRLQQKMDIKVTNLYKCYRCNKPNTCVYENVQTKGLDEESTIVVKCLLCGHSWKS
jgi:DNA-directed RNA polymerase subunit M/transcription elongation factor TFIIS